MQTLKPQDEKTRLQIACLFLARMEVDDAWPWKILWSDEAHFYLDRAMNTQNCRKWGTSPLNILHQKPLQNDYVTAWSGFTAEFILEPFFSLKLSLHKVVTDYLSRVHGTVNFFNNRSFLVYRNDNVCKPLSLCKMEQLLTLGVKSKHCT
ncbi:uncharacterized protein TNCV_1689291 [Trichonephila clavipes]|nr:uncharacterized protein TNCV_1689291 [Trichonephila clavipes]